jgi:hypothetical protein
MANQITDNRTLVDSADATTNYVASSSASQDTEIFIQGTASIGEQITNGRRYIMYNAGTPQNWSNNVFYIWINCGIVGLLDLKANGGFTIRFAGASVNDFFEFYVGGSDSWPPAIAGGWVQFVVDIEGTPSNTGGTPPLTTAIQHVGYSAITAGTMTRATDNTWLDEIRRLPDGSPGIIVEGRNGGTTDWSFADVYTQLGVSAGIFKIGEAGSYNINTPIQFGVNDTSIHGFSDTNQLILWENQEFAPSDLYKISALGNAGGTTNLTLGIKTGTGDSATGAQGITFQGAATSVRWAADFDDPNLDSINLYGCTFSHGGDFQLDNPAVEVISSTFLDCTSARTDNCIFLRNKIINANTLDGTAFLTADDLTDIKFCEFEFSDGHAIELTTPIVSVQTSKGNIFTGYGIIASTDAALYNNAAGSITINVTDGGSSPTYRNGTSATTTINSSVTVTVTVVDGTGTPVAGARTSVYLSSNNSEVMNIDTNGSGIASASFSGGTPANVYWRVRKSSTGDIKYIAKSGPSTITTTGMNITVQIDEDPNV